MGNFAGPESMKRRQARYIINTSTWEHRGVAANPDGGSQEEFLEYTVSKLRSKG